MIHSLIHQLQQQFVKELSLARLWTINDSVPEAATITDFNAIRKGGFILFANKLCFSLPYNAIKHRSLSAQHQHLF